MLHPAGGVNYRYVEAGNMNEVASGIFERCLDQTDANDCQLNYVCANLRHLAGSPGFA